MKWIIALMLSLIVVGCEGKQGPMGPPGPGDRIVYQSTTKVPASPNPYCVSVPEVKLNDMPIVSVYVSDTYGTRWVELPIYWDVGDISEGAYIYEGQVCLFNCVGDYYKIVVVI